MQFLTAKLTSTPQKTSPKQTLRKAAQRYDKVGSTPDNPRGESVISGQVMDSEDLDYARLESVVWLFRDHDDSHGCWYPSSALSHKLDPLWIVGVRERSTVRDIIAVTSGSPQGSPRTPLGRLPVTCRRHVPAVYRSPRSQRPQGFVSPIQSILFHVHAL